MAVWSTFWSKPHKNPVSGLTEKAFRFRHPNARNSCPLPQWAGRDTSWFLCVYWIRRVLHFKNFYKR